MIVTLKQINGVLDGELGRLYVDITFFATAVDDAAIADGNVSVSVKSGTVTFKRGPRDDTPGVSMAHVREARRNASKAYGRGVKPPPHVGLLCGEWSERRTFRRVFPMEFSSAVIEAYDGGLLDWFKTSLLAGRDSALAGEVPVARSASIGLALRSTMRLYAAGWRPVVDSKVWLNVLTGKHATAAELRLAALAD